jgi:hypothetical protein
MAAFTDYYGNTIEEGDRCFAVSKSCVKKDGADTTVSMCYNIGTEYYTAYYQNKWYWFKNSLDAKVFLREESVGLEF